MTKLLLTLLGLLSISMCSGQGEINNTRTENHQQIAGTKFFLVPPAGFSNATNFQGFQQMDNGASILIVEIPGPFSETTKGFNAEGLKTQGVVLVEKKEMKVNEKQGLFLTAEQSAYGTDFSKYILVFGDSTATYIINGTFPKELKELDEAIRESMFSVVHEPALTIDPMSTVPFTVDTENTKLKFAKNVTGTLLYTVDGKVPTESSDKTSLIVGVSLANVSTADRKISALTRIKRMPYDDLKIVEDEINEIEIDRISGYEIVGEGIDESNGSKELVYQVMLFTDDEYYIIVGTAKNEAEQNLELFKTIARTFKRK